MINNQKENHVPSVVPPALAPLISLLTTSDWNSFSTQVSQIKPWEGPRCNLTHWVPVLNRIDEFFAATIEKYGLTEEYPKLQIFSLQDQSIAIACLKLTLILIERCSYRLLYSSSERIYALINTPTVDVRLHAMDVALALAKYYVTSESGGGDSAPKAAKQKVLAIARAYPPAVPPNYKPAKEKEEKPSVVGDHYNYIDTITTEKKYPSKWKSLNFEYFKEAEKKPTKKVDKKGAEDYGHSTFILSEESVRKLTLEQIYDKASEIVPKEYWFEFGLVAPSAKAFNENSYDAIKLREKILQIKALAIGFTSCMCSSQYTLAKLFEPEPYIFSFLVDLIHSENESRVPNNVYLLAIKSLDAIALKKTWGNDLLRCMSGNVNHGLLFQNIRHINKKIRDNDPDFYEEGAVQFLQMLEVLIDTKSLVSRLTTGGILTDLMGFFKCETKYKRTIALAIHLTSTYLSLSQTEPITDFINKNGFTLLIETIQSEVDLAIALPVDNSDPYLRIDYQQAKYIRNLMELVSGLIQSDLGDRSRNLFDSHLLDSFNKILKRPTTFGPSILSSTVDSVFYIIHNEPTAFSILNEKLVVDTILDSYEELFIPLSTLMVSLVEVIGALCLNNDGLKKVIDKGTLSSFFKSFYKLDCAKELVRNHMSLNLGCSIDELGRHYPPLKPILIGEIAKLIKTIPNYVDEKIQGVQFYTSEKGNLYTSKFDDVGYEEEDSKAIDDWEHSEYGTLLDNVFFFLHGSVQHNGELVVEKTDCEDWFKLFTLKNLPYDFSNYNSLVTLMGTLKYLDSQNRDFGLPVLFKILKNALEAPEIQDYLNYQDTNVSYWSRDDINATLVLQKLNLVNIMLSITTEIYIDPTYIFRERVNQIIDLFGGEGLVVIPYLGKLYERSVIEDTIMRCNMPDEVYTQTRPNYDLPKDEPPILVNTEDPEKEKKKVTGTSAKFKNALQLRSYNYAFQNFIASIYTSIGSVCMFKRQDDVSLSWRKSAVEITLVVGGTMERSLKREFTNGYYRSCYMLGMSNLFLYSLTCKDLVLTSLAYSYLQFGCYTVLGEYAANVWNQLLNLDTDEVAKLQHINYLTTTDYSILKNTLYQILIIFLTSSTSRKVQQMIHSRWFFSRGFSKDDDNEVNLAFLAQIRLVIFDLLKAVIGTGSLLHHESFDKIRAGNIPTRISDQLVVMSSELLAKKEIEFIPLDVRGVTTADNKEYLVFFGLSANLADRILRVMNPVELYNKKWPEVSRLEIDTAEEGRYLEFLNKDFGNRNFEFPPTRKVAELKELRGSYRENLGSTWLHFARFFPDTVKSISELLISAALSNDANTLPDIFEYIVHLVDNEDNKGEDLGVSIHLLSLLLKNETISSKNSPVFAKFVTFASNEVSSINNEVGNNNEVVNQKYFTHLLSIVEQILLFKNIPFPKSEDVPVPFLIDEDTEEVIFNGILNIDNVTDVQSALKISRILILYTSNERSMKIAKSAVLKTLIRLPKVMTKWDQPIRQLQQSLIILIRRCNEDKSVLRSNMTVQLSTLLNNPKVKRDLNTCLRESSAMILRDPETYVDILSSMIRLEGFDGTPEYYSGKMQITTIERKPQETEPLEQTGIVHILLKELMEVLKKEWLTSPDDKPKKESSDKHEKEKPAELFKNTHFAYAFFLVQTIAELLGSYKQCKLEFLTFSKKATDTKPRLTALNFFIHQLIPTNSFETSGIQFERRNAIALIAKVALIGLVSTPILDEVNTPNYKKEDIDMAYIRRFFADVMLKILKDTSSLVSFKSKYGKLLDLFDLVGAVISSKSREITDQLLNKDATKYDLFYLSKVFSEKQIPQQLTVILAELDLNFPDVDKVIKAGLKPIAFLSKAKLEFQELLAEEFQGDKDDDDIVDDDVEEKELPDLFRNSTLGMYDDDTEEEDDYDNGPEVLMSGDEIEDDSDLSEIDSDDDVDEVISLGGSYDEDSYEDEDDEEDEDNESANDIEIIDGLSIESEDSEASDFYQFEEEENEYDDEELDGWIEEFEDSNSSEDVSDEEDTGLRRLGTLHNHDPESIESEDTDLEDLPTAPQIAEPLFELIGNVFGGEHAGGQFRTVRINGQNHRIHDHQSSLNRVFANIFNLGNKVDSDKLDDLSVDSTRERWATTMKLFYTRAKDDVIFRVMPLLIERIEDESLELYEKKRAEMEEKEEKIRKKQDEERMRQEEEATEREFNEPEVLDPVMVRIGDREVDISGTDIDPEFFEALPDDMREEVFTQHVRERRANATNSGTDAREIDPDFLNALPQQIREEILHLETISRNFARYDEDAEDLESVDSVESLEAPEIPTKKGRKILFTPMVDRQGVASLLRLIFTPLTINQREHIYHTLYYLCFNKQTRVEIMGLLIAILNEGLQNQKSIERMYSQVMGPALGTKAHHKLPSGSTTIIIGIQMIEAVDYLLERNTHLRYYLLTEHDNPFITKKKNLKKENKFSINYILKLLDNKSIQIDQTFMDISARVIQIASAPLRALLQVSDKPPFSPPIIPDSNLRQIIKILVADDCSNTTFRRAIGGIQNLSVLANAQKVFSLELSDQASSLGKKIIVDINELTKEISETGKEVAYDNKTFAKFSAPSSDQAKLLRILTALDFMFESKEATQADLDAPIDIRVQPDLDAPIDIMSEASSPGATSLLDINVLTQLYKKLSLGNLWDALSDCLRILEDRADLSNVTTALLPLIEALMVVCKHSKVRDIKDVLKFDAKKIDFSKEPIERLFFSFTDEHKKILNQMVRTNPNLMSGPFGMLVRNPRVLEFDNKKNYFDRKLHQTKNDNHKLSINIRRDQVFLDSYRALFFKSKEEFKNSKLDINFKGEAGVDAGGITREWFQVLSRQMFNPDYALFTPVASDETTFHPNRTSYVNPEHLSFFKFIGRIIGKAIYDYCFLDCHFSRAVYKRILGRAVSLKDMETLDLEYFRSLMWMLENDITDVITEDFSVETDEFGEHKIIDLIPNGRNIPATEQNKIEYVTKVVEYRLQTSVAEQMDNFLIGFHEIIPKDLVAIFDEQELELLISGLPDISVIDWQNNSTYNNYSPSSIQIQWFWRAVKLFDNEERAKLLQFATGTSKVPLNGFKELSGANGTCKFSIHRDYGSTERLPSSHTCFNQIDLPAYETYETLRGSLLLAITEGHVGFGLA